MVTLSSLGAVLHAFEQSAVSLLVHKAFWIDAERNIPTLANVSLLVSAASLCALAAVAEFRRGAERRWNWAALSLILCTLAFDEAAGVHELLMGPVGRALHVGGGPFTFAWVIPGAGFVAVIGAAFSLFLWRLPPTVRLLMAISGSVYVSGALGLEMVGGLLYAKEGTLDGTAYKIATTIEETLEMVGLIVFDAAVLRFLKPHP